MAEQEEPAKLWRCSSMPGATPTTEPRHLTMCCYWTLTEDEAEPPPEYPPKGVCAYCGTNGAARTPPGMLLCRDYISCMERVKARHHHHEPRLAVEPVPRTDVSTDVLRFGVARLKKMSLLRSPRYELPADSHLEAVVRDIVDNARHDLYEQIRRIKKSIDAKGDDLTESAHAALVGFDDLSAMLPEELVVRSGA